MAGRNTDNALDHVVVVFENRSLDNVLSRLYRPEDGQAFVDSPNPDTGRSARYAQFLLLHPVTS
jgi:hypothetical protein